MLTLRLLMSSWFDQLGWIVLHAGLGGRIAGHPLKGLNGGIGLVT